MRGYDDQSYGEGFADVYDEWYADIGDVDTAVASLAELAAGGPVLELGVGTGRLALPLAATGLEVHGVDTSAAMLSRLRAKPGADRVQVTLGDMVSREPTGPFALVVVAYNTLFNLPTPERQAAAVASAAARLIPDGRLVVEAFVPGDPPADGQAVRVRTMTVDRVVLSVEMHRPEDQVAEGQFVELTERGGVRLRPWSVRWTRPEELDDMATRAGLRLEQRWAGFDGSPFDDTSQRHVSIYRLDAPRSSVQAVSSTVS